MWHDLFFRQEDKAQLGSLHSSGLNGWRVLHIISKKCPNSYLDIQVSHSFVPLGFLPVFSTGLSHKTSFKMSFSLYAYLNLELCGCDNVFNFSRTFFPIIMSYLHVWVLNYQCQYHLSHKSILNSHPFFLNSYRNSPLLPFDELWLELIPLPLCYFCLFMSFY